VAPAAWRTVARSHGSGKQYRLATSERFKGLKRPSTAIVMAIAWQEHADLLGPSSRPPRWAMAGLARLGRLLGYRTV
jgi:hypothetical protein